MNAPSYRKLTPAVERGLRYAIASLESDAAPVTTTLNVGEDDAEVIQVTPPNAPELTAAAEWIKYQLSKRGES